MGTKMKKLLLLPLLAIMLNGCQYFGIATPCNCPKPILHNYKVGTTANTKAYNKQVNVKNTEALITALDKCNENGE